MPAVTLDQLRTDHPGWNLWSTSAALFATRHRRLSDDELIFGLAATVHADTREKPASALAEQAWLETSHAQRIVIA